MASHGRPAERGYHQDYIARIRYENNLPPPPGAPKLLNIPIEGLSYYTSAAFASRMARQQPLNIEADAELGMPIDLVGMPGIFDGDESSIQAPLAIPPTHPRDKNLLRPLSDLGKPKFTTGAHSFLRRTEYISTDARARAEANAIAAKGAPKSPSTKTPRRPTDLAKEDPDNIKRHVIKGFNIANSEDLPRGQVDGAHQEGAQPTPAEVDAWKKPRHPTNPDLKLLDSYPIKPDLDAITDSSGWLMVKFSGNPTSNSTEHDERMDVGLFNPIEVSGGEYDYAFYLPPDVDSAKTIKRKFDFVDGQDDEAPESSGAEGDQQFYKYQHHRTFDSGRQIILHNNPYKEVGLALHDSALDKQSGASNGARLNKGAYYYPINMKMHFKPKRNKNLANLGLQKQAVEDEAERPDEINLIVRDPDVDEAQKRNEHRDELILGRKATNGSIAVS